MCRSAEDVFDAWAMDYHAAGMEDDHRRSVMEAFEQIDPSTGNYLEVGVGNGYGLQWIATHQFKDGYCRGLDVSGNMVAVARERTRGLKNVSVSKADFLSYNPDDQSAPDLIFSMEVFYYFPSIAEGIKHAYNILRPGGRLAVLVNHFKERLDSHEWGSQLDTHMELWSAADYEAGFRHCGFVDVTQEYVGVPADPETQKINPGTLATWGAKPF